MRSRLPTATRFPFRRDKRKPDGTWDAPDATDDNIKGTSIDPYDPLWPRWRNMPPLNGEGEFVSSEPFFDIDEITQKATLYPAGTPLLDRNVDGNPGSRQRVRDIPTGNLWRQRLLVGGTEDHSYVPTVHEGVPGDEFMSSLDLAAPSKRSDALFAPGEVKPREGLFAAEDSSMKRAGATQSAAEWISVFLVLVPAPLLAQPVLNPLGKIAELTQTIKATADEDAQDDAAYELVDATNALRLSDIRRAPDAVIDDLASLLRSRPYGGLPRRVHAERFSDTSAARCSGSAAGSGGISTVGGRVQRCSNFSSFGPWRRCGRPILPRLGRHRRTVRSPQLLQWELYLPRPARPVAKSPSVVPVHQTVIGLMRKRVVRESQDP